MNFILNIILLLIILSCNQDKVSGTDDVQDTGVVAGILLDSNNSPAIHIPVKLMKSNCLPYIQGNCDGPESYTDSSGKYSLELPDSGTYNLSALATQSKLGVLAFNLIVKLGQTQSVPTQKLTPLANVKVILPKNGEITQGYLYIPGTPYSIYTDENKSDTLTLVNVPVGLIPSLEFQETQVLKTFQISQNIDHSKTGTVIETPFIEWKYSTKITLNTSETGANLKTSLFQYPLLVRLNSNNFNFGEAEANGSDLRFTNSTGNPLTFSIEKWDLFSKEASIWVLMDTVFPNQSAQFISMYWGNSQANSLSKPKSVFDTANGFAGVWQFSEDSTSAQHHSFEDQTPNLNHDSVSVLLKRPSYTSGNMGAGVYFDGMNQGILIPHHPSLDFQKKPFFTLSLWVKPMENQISQASLLCKGYAHSGEQYCLDFNHSENFYRAYVWDKTSPTPVQDSSLFQLRSPLPPKPNWEFLTYTFDGTSMQTLYVNGVEVARKPVSLDSLTSTSLPLSIGTKRNNPDSTYSMNFKGILDEIRISRTVRSSDWIKMDFLTQSPGSSLLTFSK